MRVCVRVFEGQVCPIPVARACSSHSVSHARFLAVRGELITTFTRRGKSTVHAGLLLLFILGMLPTVAKHSTALKCEQFICVREREREGARERDVRFQLMQQV